MHHTFGETRRHNFSLLSNPIPRLLIKSAILMPSAKKDDVNIVQIESEGYNKEKVKKTTLYFRLCIKLYLKTFLMNMMPVKMNANIFI